MYVCTACGSGIPEGRRFCPVCGAMPDQNAEYVEDANHQGGFAPGYAQVNQPHQPNRPSQGGYDPAYNYQSPEKSRERVMGTGEFFFSILLMFLPGLGLLIQIIWACGGARNKNRIHLARGFLIFTVIMYIALLVGLYFAYLHLWPVIEAMTGGM